MHDSFVLACECTIALHHCLKAIYSAAAASGSAHDCAHEARALVSQSATLEHVSRSHTRHSRCTASNQHVRNGGVRPSKCSLTPQADGCGTLHPWSSRRAKYWMNRRWNVEIYRLDRDPVTGCTFCGHVHGRHGEQRGIVRLRGRRGAAALTLLRTPAQYTEVAGVF